MIIPYAIIIHINYIHCFHIILTCCKSNNNHNYNNHHDFNGLNNQISHDSYRTKSMRIYDKKSNDIDFYSSHEQCESCMEWGKYDDMDFSYDYNCYLCHNCSGELQNNNYHETTKK